MTTKVEKDSKSSTVWDNLLDLIKIFIKTESIRSEYQTVVVFETLEIKSEIWVASITENILNQAYEA